MRVCKKCQKELPLDSFRVVKTKGRTYRRYTCKPCTNTAVREQRKTDADFRRRSQNATRKYKYGITEDQMLQMLIDQGGGCAICGTLDATWCIDHDHACCSDVHKTCGKCVRGILCNECNLGIANFSDDPKRLLSAVDYLTQRQSPI